MSSSFFDRPILNSPYDYPARHWELDETGQPRSTTSRDVKDGNVDHITREPEPEQVKVWGIGLGRTSDRRLMVRRP
jgi:type III restriction enzyme